MSIADFRLATLDPTQDCTWSRLAIAAGDVDWYDNPIGAEATSGFRPAAPPLANGVDRLDGRRGSVGR